MRRLAPNLFDCRPREPQTLVPFVFNLRSYPSNAGRRGFFFPGHPGSYRLFVLRFKDFWRKGSRGRFSLPWRSIAFTLQQLIDSLTK